MSWQPPLQNSFFSLDNSTPPQLFSGNFQQQIQPLPQYQTPNPNYIKPLANPAYDDVLNSIIDLKTQWAEADKQQKQLAQRLSGNEYTDAQKQEFQKQINLYQTQKKEFADLAEKRRNAARSLGIDTTGFNADVPLSEVLQLKNARATQGLLNLKPTPQDKTPSLSYINTLTNPTAAGFLNDTVKLKELWEGVNEQEQFYTNLLNSGKYNAAQNQELQTQIGLLQLQKKEIANSAEQMRNAARSLGIDTAGFNADNTLAEARQLKLNSDARAVQGLLNLKSTAQQQEDYYNEMRAAGLDPRLAGIAASQKFNEFRENNVNQLMTGLQNYGLNDDGSINQFGMNLMGKLTNENPYVAELFTNKFASPKDAYAESNANYRQNAASENQRLLNLENMQNEWARLRATQDFARTERQAAQENAERMTFLNAALKGTGVPQDKLAQEIENLKRLGLTDEAAKELYLVQHYPEYFKINRDDKGNIKQTDAEKATNVIAQQMRKIKYFLMKKDYETANQLIAQYKEALLSDDYKYQEQIDDVILIALFETLDLAQKVANGEITFEEMEAMMNGTNEPSVGNLSRTNHNTKANREAAKIGKEYAERFRRLQAVRDANPPLYGNWSPPSYGGNWGNR